MESIMWSDRKSERRRTKSITMPILFFFLEIRGIYLILKILHFGYDISALGYFILGVSAIFLYDKLVRILQRQRVHYYRDNSTVVFS